MFKLILFYTIFLYTFLFINAIPIPNGQLGEAEVECGENDIEIEFITEDIFLGRVFVVGHANETNCVSREIGKRTTSILIKRNECGVTVIRSNNPPGLFVNVKVMISFHDEFITKIDRGYEISCFYMEADKTVTYPISVASNTLQPLNEFSEMPRCQYEVVDTITHMPANVVSVGKKLLHKWTCESSAPNLWCMTVHSCFVEDGSGTEFAILSDEGCAIDRYLLDNLEYGPGLLQAQKEAHAFKFADRVVMNFQCSIRLDIKGEAECPIPKCPDLSKQRPRINKRSINEDQKKNYKYRMLQGYTELDVRAPKIDVLDPQIGFGSEEVLSDRLSLINKQNCIPINLLIVPACLIAGIFISLNCAIIYLLLKPIRL